MALEQLMHFHNYTAKLMFVGVRNDKIQQIRHSKINRGEKIILTELDIFDIWQHYLYVFSLYRPLL